MNDDVLTASGGARASTSSRTPPGAGTYPCASPKACGNTIEIFTGTPADAAAVAARRGWGVYQRPGETDTLLYCRDCCAGAPCPKCVPDDPIANLLGHDRKAHAVRATLAQQFGWDATPERIADTNPGELADLRGIGIKSVALIRRGLAEVGLSLLPWPDTARRVGEEPPAPTLPEPRNTLTTVTAIPDAEVFGQKWEATTAAGQQLTLAYVDGQGTVVRRPALPGAQPRTLWTWSDPPAETDDITLEDFLRSALLHLAPAAQLQENSKLSAVPSAAQARQPRRGSGRPAGQGRERREGGGSHCGGLADDHLGQVDPVTAMLASDAGRRAIAHWLRLTADLAAARAGAEAVPDDAALRVELERARIAEETGREMLEAMVPGISADHLGVALATASVAPQLHPYPSGDRWL